MATNTADGHGQAFRRWHPYYPYSPLPDNAIRLIRIIQPEFMPIREKVFESLQVSMITVDLADAPAYDALSYTWGDPTPKQDPTTRMFTKVARCYPIQCSGRGLLGTRNLRDALRRLRSLQHPEGRELREKDLGRKLSKYIWIDSLCINQDDFQERSKQVSLMQTIYKTADAVFAWLGEADDRARSALNVALQLSNVPSEHQKNVYDQAIPWTDPEFYRACGATPVTEAQWLDYALFFSRNWFTRAWILQEARLAKRLEMCCGTKLFDSGMLAASLSFVNRCDLGDQITELQALDSDASLTPYHDQVHLFNKGLRLFQIRRPGPEGIKRSFVAMLFLNSRTEATEPHDRVHSLLGICTEFDEGRKLEADYSRQIGDVYVETARFILERRRDLELLSLRQIQSKVNIKSLPFWCPDYSAPMFPWPFRDYVQEDNPGCYSASGENRWEPSLRDDAPRFLHLDGRKYDVILHSLDGIFGASLYSLVKGIYDKTMSLEHISLLDMILDVKIPQPVVGDSRYSSTRIERLFRCNVALDIKNPGTIPDIPKLEEGFRAVYSFSLIQACSISRDMTNDFYPVKLSMSKMHAFLDRLKRLLDAEPGSRRLLPRIDALLNGIPGTVEDEEEDICTIQMSQFELVQEVGATLGAMTRAAKYLGVARARVLGRTTFRTENHHIGIGPESLQNQDEIWLVAGAKMPIVLRPLPNGHYNWVGEAYMDGIMYGEGLPFADESKQIIVE